MDTAGQATSVSAHHEQRSTLFFCRLCQLVYRQPKLLKCLHTVCTPCLMRTVQEQPATENNTDKVVCPLCSFATDLPPGGVTNLTGNVFLQRVSDDYVTEVKNNLVAKAQSPQLARKLGDSEGASSGMRRRLSEDLAFHKRANLTDEQKTKSSGRSLFPGGMLPLDTVTTTEGKVLEGEEEISAEEADQLPTLAANRGSISGESTASALEAIQNMSRFQNKLMSLQGEALRVTYAIDHINQYMSDWHQHKEDLKREVQHRSNQFQVSIKRMEIQILSQIESKAMEDQLHVELDKGKSELRQNLKMLLHEVSVMKSMQKLGKYSEINQLSASLLAPPAGLGEVFLNDLSYQLDVPTKPIDEMVSVGFGNLVTTRKEQKVYQPELRDFTNVPVEQLKSEFERDNQVQQFGMSEEHGRGVGEEAEVLRGRSHVSKRSSSISGRPKRQVNDLSLDRRDVQKHLEEFQNARETFRNRRQEILRQGQTAREDHSPLRGESQKFPRPTFRTGRGQSLDRSSSSNLEESRRALSLLQTSKADNTQLEDSVDDDKEVGTVPQEESWHKTPFPSASPIFHTHGMRSDDMSVPSPITEEGSLPGSPKKGVASSNEISAMETEITSAVKILGPKFSSNPPSRKSSLDNTPPLSPNAESVARANDSIRPLRRAINSAADKRSKMEFLRENWQKRKEILIQSQGFVSSDVTTGQPKTDTASGGSPVPSPVQKQFPDVLDKELGDTKPQAQTTSAPLIKGYISPPLRTKFRSVKQMYQGSTQPQTQHVANPASGHSLQDEDGAKRIFLSSGSREREITRQGSASAITAGSTSSNVEASTLPGSKQQEPTWAAPSKTISFDNRHSKNTADDADDEEEEEEEETVVTTTVTIPLDSRQQHLPGRDHKLADAAMALPQKPASSNICGNDNVDDEEEGETVVMTTVTVPLDSGLLGLLAKESSDEATGMNTPTTTTSIAKPPSIGSRDEEEEEDVKEESTREALGAPTEVIQIPAHASTSSSMLLSTSSTITPIPAAAATATSLAHQTTPNTTFITIPASRPAATSIFGHVTTSLTRIPVGSTMTAPSPAAATTTNSTIGRTATQTPTSTFTSAFAPPPTAALSENASATLPAKFSPTSSKKRDSVTINRGGNITSQTLTSSATTTSVSSTAPSTSTISSPSSSTTSLSYSGRYKRCHIPRMETIDVAALLANMYKPSPSASNTVDNKDKTRADENKENAKNEREKNADNSNKTKSDDSKTDSIKATSSSIDINTKDSKSKSSLQTIAHHYDTDANTRGGKASLLGEADSPSATETNDITVYKITTQTQSIPVSSVGVTSSTENRTPVRMTEVPMLTKTLNSSSGRDEAKLNSQQMTFRPQGSSQAYLGSSQGHQGSTETSPTTTPNTLTGSTTTGSTRHHQLATPNPPPSAVISPLDQKVDDTFTQAESRRKRYDPATKVKVNPRQSNRRHTVEISKTIPEGTRLSEMLKPQTNANDPAAFLGKGAGGTGTSTSAESPLLQSPRMDVLHQTLFEERGTTNDDDDEYHHQQKGAISPSPRLQPVNSLTASATYRGTSLSDPFTPTGLDPSSAIAIGFDLSGSGASNSGGMARDKLREITRKKKERWRRLTIS